MLLISAFKFDIGDPSIIYINIGPQICMLKIEADRKEGQTESGGD